MVHRRIKLVLSLVMLAMLLPFSPAQSVHAATSPALVKDINPGAASSFPDQFVTTNGTLFFSTLGARKQRSLWKSDGSAAGTALLKPAGFTKPAAVVGNSFYFGVYDSIPNSLWKSDGTIAGTSKVADVAVQIDTRNSGVAFQGKLFFSAGSSSPDDLTQPLWSSDGTATGTVPIAFAGSEHQRVVEMVVSGNTLYFVTFDKSADASEVVTRPILYRSDGTAAGTQKLLQPDDDNSFISELTPNGDTLFFKVDDANPLTDGELWTSDGTATGTAPLADATGQLVGHAFGLFNFNGLIVFSGGPTVNEDNELWRSDGTPGGTFRIKDINRGGGSSVPSGFAVFNNLLYFGARDNLDDTQVDTFGGELWRSDGTEAGTVRVTDINPGPASSNPSSLMAFNGALYFSADNGGGLGATLWQSDGTAAGTVQLIAPATGQALKADSGSYGQAPISAVNNSLFFAADDGRTGVELWKLAEVTGRVTTGLRALYDFHEGTGSVVHDVAGAGNPLDLTIKKPSQVRWGAGNLEITGFTPIASNGPATKLIEAAKTSDAVTVEAWVTPANVAQYSARILTISPNATVRNLTLAQGVFNQNDATLASLRIRTTATASSGQEVFSPSGSMQPALTHLVGTIGDGVVRIYVNGTQVAQAKASGTLDNWNPSYPLILAGEQPSGRGWRGTYHLVAIYDRALSAAEVAQNYAAGPEAP